MRWDRQAFGGLAVVLAITVYLMAAALTGRIEDADAEATYAQDQAAAAEQRAEEAGNRIDDLESRLDDLERRSSYHY